MHGSDLACHRSPRRRLHDRAPATTLGKFLVVGGFGVLLNSCALFIFYQQIGLPLVVSSVLAVELAIAGNFVGHNLWTFGRNNLSPCRFARFNLVSMGGLAITTGVLWLLGGALDVPYLAANLVGIGLATGWNFLANLVWTWS